MKKFSIAFITLCMLFTLSITAQAIDSPEVEEPEPTPEQTVGCTYGIITGENITKECPDTGATDVSLPIGAFIIGTAGFILTTFNHKEKNKQ